MTEAKKIGFWSSTSLVVGNMIGSGIFLLPASLAAYGAISILGWICSSIGAILLAIVFGKLGRLAPDTIGGPFAYTKLGLGRLPAFLVAWGYWISIWCTNAAIAVALVGYLEVFIPILGEHALYSISAALSVIWFFTWINSKPLKTVALVQLLTTILKIIPIFLVGCIGIFYVNGDFFSPINLSTESSFSAITSTMTLTLFAFLGMESASITSAETKNPKKTVSRATITGTMVTVVIYILCSIAIMGIVPPASLAESTAPFADAAYLFWGEISKFIVAGGAVIACLGALNGWILIQGQIPMAAAQADLFPPLFGRKNKNKAPILGIVISSVLASGLMMLNYSKSLVDAFTFMMKLSTLSVLTPYIFSILSLLVLYHRRNNTTWKNGLLGFLALIFCLWVVYGCGLETVLWGLGLLILGLPFYLKLKNAKV